MRPPTSGEWFGYRFLASNACLWLLGITFALGIVLRVPVLVALATLSLAVQLVARHYMRYDEQEDSFSIPVDGATAERLAIAAMESLEPDQSAERDDDGVLSIDLWRRGALIGVHLVVVFRRGGRRPT